MVVICRVMRCAADRKTYRVPFRPGLELPIPGFSIERTLRPRIAGDKRSYRNWSRRGGGDRKEPRGEGGRGGSAAFSCRGWRLRPQVFARRSSGASRRLHLSWATCLVSREPLGLPPVSLASAPVSSTEHSWSGTQSFLPPGDEEPMPWGKLNLRTLRRTSVAAWT